MLTIPDIVRALGATNVGRACGFNRNPGARGHDFARRKSIPPRYWDRIVLLAKSQSRDDIDYCSLVEAHKISKPVVDAYEVRA